MKELNNINSVYLEEYDVHVNPYLSYAEIQSIVDGTKKLDTWAEREQNIDMMILWFVTDIEKGNFEKYTHDDFLKSGLLHEVKSKVYNKSLIYTALNYTESTQRALAQILKELPKNLAPLEKVMTKYGDKK